MSNSRSKRQTYYRDDNYERDAYVTGDDPLNSKYSRKKYIDDESMKGGYSSKENYYTKDVYSRDGGGYGHGGYGGGHGGYGGGHGGYGGGYHMSYGGKKFDLYSVLAFGAFALAVGFLIFYCLPDPTRCDGMARRRRRSARNAPNDTLPVVAREMDFILGLIESAESIWDKQQL